MSNKIRFNPDPIADKALARKESLEVDLPVKNMIRLIAKNIEYEAKRAGKLIQKYKKNLDFEDLVDMFSEPQIELQFLWNWLIKIRNQRVKSKIKKYQQTKRKTSKKKSAR
jgi:hypothetical protein